MSGATSLYLPCAGRELHVSAWGNVGGPVLVASIGQVLHPRHHLIAVGKDVVEHRWAVA